MIAGRSSSLASRTVIILFTIVKAEYRALDYHLKRFARIFCKRILLQYQSSISIPASTKNPRIFLTPLTDLWIRMRLRFILRKRRGCKDRARGKNHQRLPNRYFTELGLFYLLEAKIMKIVSLRYGANHSLERRIREICKSYYERGADQTNVLLLPLLENYARLTSGCKDRQGPRRTHQS